MRERARSRERERDRRDRDRGNNRDRRDRSRDGRYGSGDGRGGGRERSGGGGGKPRLPPRAPSNPLIAEAFRLARERAKAAAAAAGEDSGGEPAERPPSRGWRGAASGDDQGSPESGELRDGAADASPGGSPGSRKRKHAPIVWHTPPGAKAARSGGGLAHVGSSKGLDSLAPAGASRAPMSAAERALEEVMAFRQQQGGAGSGSNDEPSSGGPLLKPSPSASSGEEEEAAAQHDRAGSGSPTSHHAPGGDEPPTGGALPRRANRWTAAAEADAAAQRGGSPAAAAGDAGSDAERSRGGGADEAGRESGGESEAEEEAPHRFAKRCVDMLQECRSVECYEKLNRISEGTYGVVYRARDRATGEICALKKVKLEKERDGFPLTSIREINILLSLEHPHVVSVGEVVVGPSLDSVFMVMEYADHDLKTVMEERMTQAFSVAEVKTLMLQLLSGMAYLHDAWVLHRDLKTSNILYTNRGQLKLCDFGLARQYGSPLAPYTHMVVTLWYRAPELLLGQRQYSTAVDVWSIGCIMAELLSKEALFAGKSEIDQLTTILKVMGSPTEQTWPGLSKLPNARKFNLGRHPPGQLRQRFPPAGLGFDGRPPLSEAGFNLLSRLLEMCPERRISCAEALEHPWFREQPLPKDPALMPTFPATNDATQARHAAQRRAAAAAAARAAAAK